MLAVVVSVPVSVTVYDPAATLFDVVLVPLLLPQPAANPSTTISARQPNRVRAPARILRNPNNSTPASAAALSGMVSPRGGSPFVAACPVPPTRRKLCTP